MSSPPSVEACRAALLATAEGASVEEALRRAADVLTTPWEVVEGVGPLARARWVEASQDGALTASFRVVARNSGRAIMPISAGQLVPAADLAGRRARGAFDTAREMARRAVGLGMDACEGDVRRAWDPACGAGALVVAMVEAGIDEVIGSDTDPRAVLATSLAAPTAHVSVADLLRPTDEQVDLVVGNPPFVSPERQDKALRTRLRKEIPWLAGRFDLAVPCADAMVERVRPGGGVSLILPIGALVQRYGEPLRRRWLQRHRLRSIGAAESFAGAVVDVSLVSLTVGRGPAPVGCHGLDPTSVLALPLVPLHAETTAADLELVRRVRSHSRALGEVMRIDTGLVAHGPDGGKERLLHDEEAPGRVRFADARDFFAGRHRWLSWEPERMHRPKDEGLFAPDKLVVQRVRGRSPTRAAVDRQGIYVGHTCTVAVPSAPCPPLDRLAELLADPMVAGVLRLERGAALDLYPHAVAAVPVPSVWWEDPTVPLNQAWRLSPEEGARLAGRARC